MSIDSAIIIKFQKPLSGQISAIKIIQMLRTAGWTFNDHGGCSYLPLEENEGFHWAIQEKISADSLILILKKKEEQNKLIGVVLTWQNTNIGGSFLFRSNDLLSINLMINRKKISSVSNFDITDVSWYLERLLPIFNKNDLYIEYFTYEESI